MITTFYFDQDLFEDDLFNNAPALLNQLLDMWKNYGCLAICPNNKSALIAAVSSIPVKYQQKWQMALTTPTFKKISIVVAQNMLSALNGLPDFQAQYYEKNVLTGVLPLALQDAFEDKFTTVGKDIIEIISPCSLTESQNFIKSQTHCLLDIRAGDNFADVWSSRFQRMAESSKTITIIDRYLALNLEEDIQKGKTTALECLIIKLGHLNKKFTIDVFSACDINRADRQVNAARIKDYLNNTLIKKVYFNAGLEVKFSLCKDSLFRDKAHDRMLCFDEHVVQVGKGMEIFREKPIENNTFTIKSRLLTSFDDIYKILSRNRAWVYRP
jgi:hypothetical protein